MTHGSFAMTAVADVKEIPGDAQSTERPKLDHALDMKTLLVFLAILAGGLFFAAYSISQDVSAAGTQVTTWAPFLLLGVALLIALGFEFVNGFHDTANAVANSWRCALEIW
jgi:PiT family inorganic phosphate transporter